MLSIGFLLHQMRERCLGSGMAKTTGFVGFIGWEH